MDGYCLGDTLIAYGGLGMWDTGGGVITQRALGDMWSWAAASAEWIWRMPNTVDEVITEVSVYACARKCYLCVIMFVAACACKTLIPFSKFYRIVTIRA